MVGRFLQEDEYRGDGLNLYAYCANNPVVYYDPSGYAIDRAGDYDYDGIDKKNWKLSQSGEGAHMVEKVNVSNRNDLSYFKSKDVCTYYLEGSILNSGAAHQRLHQATKAEGINLQGGNSNLSDKDLIKKYYNAYGSSELDGIKGDVRNTYKHKDKKVDLGKNYTPQEAYLAILKDTYEKDSKFKTFVDSDDELKQLVKEKDNKDNKQSDCKG